MNGGREFQDWVKVLGQGSLPSSVLTWNFPDMTWCQMHDGSRRFHKAPAVEIASY